MNNFPNEIAKLCIEKYNILKKTGKPLDNEWTVLSGIILKRKNKLSIVSLATGTKCLGQTELLNTKLHERGCRLSDSHAEVLARRAFLRYLYDQIDLVLNGFESDVFFLSDCGKIKIKADISFHFFASQTPCGDCSIIVKKDDYDEVDNESNPPLKIRKIENANLNMSVPLIIKRESDQNILDIHRTGAKCIKTEELQDSKLPGINYHVVGPLRTKPGRGDPTLSLSCSDKIAKWNILGIQGSLLSLIIPQLKLESITIGGDCPFSLEAMERGLCGRFDKQICVPKIYQAKLAFVHKKGFKRLHPCPSSIIWCAVRESELEIAAAGRKQGATKKKRSVLLVSRRALLEVCLKVCDKYNSTKFQTTHPKKITYYNCKQSSTQYQKTWKHLRLNIFHNWPIKPLDLHDFVL